MSEPHYLVRYRESGADEDAAWTTAPTMSGEAERIEIPGLVPGRAYDVRVKLFDEEGLGSEEFVIESHVAAGLETEPPNVADLVVTGGCLHWRAPIDTRFIHGYQVRYALGEVESWDEMTPAHEGVWPGPPFPLCGIPAGIVTFGVVAVSVDGRRSVIPVFTPANRGAFDAREAVLRWELDHAALGFPATQKSGAVSGGDLLAPATGGLYGPETVAWYGDHADVLYGEESGDGLYGPDPTPVGLYGPDDGSLEYGDTEYEDLVYQPRVQVPAGAVVAADSVLTLDVQLAAGRGLKVEYRRDETLYGPDNGSADFGAEDGEPDATALYGSGEPGSWRPWPGSIPAIPGLHEFRIRAPGGQVRPALDVLTVAVTSPA